MLAYLAKPTNPVAASNKVRNWKLWLTPGETTLQRRSRRQVEGGLLDVWNGLHDAVKIGERYQKMATFHEGSARLDPTKAVLADWAEPVGSEDLTRWKNWLPLAHYAAAFREVLFKRNLGSAFRLEKTQAERIRIVHKLLIEEHDWVPQVIEQGMAWLNFARLHGRVQSPGTTIIFAMRPSESGDRFAKMDPHTLN
ncbi:hypothetical protein PMI04_000555 [Sphingobium sp. AP49]|uniref:hypothetical protein n=1 Tax=Sphingobium sp. AP49 TaxID=1144307 RepID=UPI00056D596E|nr:hypothetical protein [Sphingobium sp. AP49]WHO39128.1 hypothetical protein PMI04_000555 [Sphingobium sp. AP49]